MIERPAPGVGSTTRDVRQLLIPLSLLLGLSPVFCGQLGQKERIAVFRGGEISGEDFERRWQALPGAYLRNTERRQELRYRLAVQMVLERIEASDAAAPAEVLRKHQVRILLPPGPVAK